MYKSGAVVSTVDRFEHPILVVNRRPESPVSVVGCWRVQRDRCQSSAEEGAGEASISGFSAYGYHVIFVLPM